MLEEFDWLKLCPNGGELLATFSLLKQGKLPIKGEEAPPHTALQGPCLRCGFYPRVIKGAFCDTCWKILCKSARMSIRSKITLLIWGRAEPIPEPFLNPGAALSKNVYGMALDSQNCFLLAVKNFDLKEILQETAFYHGPNIRGHLLVFPTVGPWAKHSLNKILINVMQQELGILDQGLSISFFSNPFWLLNWYKFKRINSMVQPIEKFISLLDMAQNFRTFFFPEQQEEIRSILKIKSYQERMFHWNRLLGLMEYRSKEFLESLNIVNWPQSEVTFFYQLLAHVPFKHSN